MSQPRNRKSRAGQNSHPSGHRATKVSRPPADPPSADDDGAHEQQPSRKPVTVPELKFLQRKPIAGELI